MSSPKAEAFSNEAQTDKPARNGVEEEPSYFGQDAAHNEQELKSLAAKGAGETTDQMEGEEMIATDPVLNDAIRRFENVDDTETLHTNGFTFKRTKSSDRVGERDAGQEEQRKENNGDLESDAGSHLPSPPASVGTPDDTISVQVYLFQRFLLE